MLTDEEITGNRETYLMLLESIKREGFNREGLVEYLNSSDFFTAPASRAYHCSYKGGLCQHSLNVYKNLLLLVDKKGLTKKISQDNIIITSLMHDYAKINFYTSEIKNKKVYCDTGSKSDSMGRFDWVSVEGYGYVPDDKRFMYGNHETTSEFIARYYVPLTLDESVAILHHHMGMSADCAKDNISGVMNNNPLALLLHLADMMSCYLDEKV